MIAVTKKLVSCQIESDHLVVRCDYDAEINRWLTGMGLRFDPRLNGFKSLASASLAKMLTVCPVDHAHVEIAPDVRALSNAASQSQIDFETQPDLREVDLWRHQVGAYNFKRERDAVLFQMRMGTGKTLPTVCTMRNENWRKTLVLCPAKVRGVWRREVAKWWSSDVPVLVLDKPSWNNKRQAKESEDFLRRCAVHNQPAVIVQNYESAMRPDFSRFALATQWDGVICDESHRIAKHGSKVSKFAAKLGRKAKHRMCLSGTSLAHSPLDVFGQARFLDPRIFGESWAQFRNRYAVSGPFGADHVVSYKNMDELADLMDAFTYQVGDDVLDLPDFHEVGLTCELPAKVAKIYAELETEFCAAVADEMITASNGLVKLLRLQQMTSGHVALESGEIEQLHDTKGEVLSELLSDMDTREPFVVFCRFTEDLKRVQAIAERTGRRYGEISGSRCDLTPNAEMPEDVDLMGVQIQSGGVGIDLTRARYAAYYSIGYSLSDYDQSLARVKRPGQTKQMTFFHLVTKGTVDETVYRALKKRRDLIDAVLEQLRNKGTR